MAQWFFTAPSESVRVRRGDTLGLRAASNDFGDLLAPGLSNRTQDARWFTLLAFALVRSDEAMRFYRGSTRLGTRYDWIRPVELLWVARSLTLLEDGAGRQLPGQRAIGRWLDRPKSRRDDAIGLSRDQARQYRFNGSYGAYRVAIRDLLGFTRDGDGWRPGRLALRLERHAARFLRVGRLSVKGKARPYRDPSRFWLRRGWPAWHSSGGVKLLPTPRDSSRRLLSWECAALAGPLFGTDSQRALRRRKTIEVLALSDALTHSELTGAVAKKLGADTPELVLLPPFSRLADAGVAAMNRLWQGLVDQGGEPTVRINRALEVDGLGDDLMELGASAREWVKTRESLEAPRLRNLQMVDLLAERVAKSPDDARRVLVALLTHHALAGGGVRWFRLDESNVVRTAPQQSSPGAEYRFRLWQVARLGVQVGVINHLPMPLRRAPAGAMEDVSP